MEDSLELCLASLSKIDRENGTDPALLKTIYDRVVTESDLAILIANLPQQNRAGRRALWRFSERQLKSYAEKKGEIIQEAFELQVDQAAKLDFLYFISAFGKIHLMHGIFTKSIWQWIVDFTREKFMNIRTEDLSQISYLTKILNVIITKTDDDIISTEINQNLFPIMLAALKTSEFQLHIEFLASLAVLLVSFTISMKFPILKVFEMLSIGNELGNYKVYELFITRALLSSLSKPELEQMFDMESTVVDILMIRLIEVCSEQLEPTQLCYALRGIAESLELLEKKKISLSTPFYDSLPNNHIYDRFGEHPLDVVRINTWKIYSIDTSHKIAKKELYKEKLKSEIESLFRSEKSSRFELIKLTAFCDKRIFDELCEVFPIDNLVNRVITTGSTQSLAPLCGNILARVCQIVTKQCVDAVMSCYNLEMEEFDSNAKRLFGDVVLPKMLSENKIAGDMIIDKCRPFTEVRLTHLAITGNRFNKL